MVFWFSTISLQSTSPIKTDFYLFYLGFQYVWKLSKKKKKKWKTKKISSRQLHTFCLLWVKTAEKLQKRAEFEKSVLLAKLTVIDLGWRKICTPMSRAARFFFKKYFLFCQVEWRKFSQANRRRFDLPPSTSPPTLGGATLTWQQMATKCSTNEISLFPLVQ